MNESGGFEGFGGFDDVSVEGDPTSDAPPVEDVVDAEVVGETLADGTELSTSTELEVAEPVVLVTGIDGVPVDPPEDESDLPEFGAEFDPDLPAGGHGQQRYPGAGGGSARTGLFGRRRRPKAAGAKFGKPSGTGSAGGRGGASSGGTTVNLPLANPTVIVQPTVSTTVSPAVTGVAVGGGAKSPDRRPVSTGRRRPSGGVVTAAGKRR